MTVVIVDDHLLLAVLAGVAPASLAGERLATTTAWWWRAVAPLAAPRVIAGRHSKWVASLPGPVGDALWDSLTTVGQPASLIRIPELVPLGPAMAWLARAEGLNRLAAEAMAVALDLEAPIRVGPGNGGALLEVAVRLGVDAAELVA